ncbi:signal peptidase I [Lactobacillus xylocopicola]|uniref:Signal peptidase I n=1 Tax=Lactobacillus xylocopicola TaxID=2976676 RepID=A0ABM8BEW2_9LACO|nr:signal peptidase I [Lactobacillus xylocopicola]BDR59774.1 signal peptidase I [Lactobacillus xylocopicola]
MSNSKNKQNSQQEESLGKFILDIVVMMVVILGGYYLLFNFVLSNDRVSGPSMQPTFEDGDRLISVRNFEPRRDDIVILKAPKKANDPGALYIKRIIGLPGDTVESKNDQMYINGKKMAQPFLNNSYKKKHTDPRNPYTNNFNIGSWISTKRKHVPQGHYFVMGDHRDVSSDSRRFGFVKRSEIIGQVKLRYWPFNQIQGF